MIPERLYDKAKGCYYETDPHQRVAYQHLAQRKRAALFLGMALQKTVVTLSVLYELHYREVAITKTLVVAPDKVARITWPQEIQKWGHLDGMRYSVVAGTPKQRVRALEEEAEIYIVGVDNLVWLIDRYIRKVGGRWRGKLPFDCLVIDELSLFKSRGAERWKALRRAVGTIEYRYGLTGTPAPNGLVDLWAQILLLDDGERLGRRFGEFVDRYFTVRGNGMIVYEYRPKPGAAKQIAAKLADLVLSMKTRDYIELPELHTVDTRIRLDHKEEEEYRRLEREYVLELVGGEGVVVNSAAELTNKLLQITSGAVYLEAEEENAGGALLESAEGGQLVGEQIKSGNGGEKRGRRWREVNRCKIEALRGLLEEFPEETFIVVYQFRHEVERIRKAFPFARVLGKGAKTAEDFKEWNEGKIRLLLIHPAGAGHGLNLQFGGRRMVWFSLSWNLEHYQQTVARLLRRGQRNEIFVHRLLVEGTVDERVARKIEGKEEDQSFFLDEVGALRKKYGI